MPLKHKYLTDHSYTITAKHSGLCLDLQTRSASAGTPIIQDDCDAGNSETFLIEPTLDNSFNLVSTLTGFCFDVPYGSVADNVGINQYPCNAGDNQRFWFVALGDGSYEVENVPSGKCLTVPGASTDSGVAIVQLSCQGALNQRFSLAVLDGGGLAITTPTTNGMADAIAGAPYFRQLLASGGQPPYTWSTPIASLPFGMSLSPAGALTGTPILVNGWVANFSAPLTVVDAAGSQVQTSLNFRVLKPDPFAPQVNAGGVVRGAAPAVPLPSIPIGGFVSIYGTQLAPASASGTLPFSTQLNNVSVSLANRPLPIAYVSSQQINAIVPYDTPVNGPQRLYVTSNGRTSIGQSVAVAAYQPSIFTLNQAGTGQGAITNAVTGVLAEAASPVGVGDPVTIYCTGLGGVTPPVADGIPAPLAPLSWTNLSPVVTIGGLDAKVLFSGLAPEYAGLYQVNTVVPSGVAPGQSVPVVVNLGGAQSPPVTIAVQ
jgi:uncharacterized protein (TIGR03437 family)